jgi:hypothetical protein
MQCQEDRTKFSGLLIMLKLIQIVHVFQLLSEGQTCRIFETEIEMKRNSRPINKSFKKRTVGHRAMNLLQTLEFT